MSVYKRIARLGLPLAAVTLLGACEQEIVQRDESVKQIATFVVEEATKDGIRNMPARLVASQRVELSFRVDGKLTELRVREGDDVGAGDVLAVLDQSDFRNNLADKEAAFINAQTEYERAKTLIVDGAISQRDYDQVKAEFGTSRAAFEQAKVDLEYTVLRAPFTGEVATRAVENFEEVKAGQQIFYVTDTSRMDVKFSVPEGVMILIDDAAKEAGEEDYVEINLSLSDRPGEVFPMEFKESAQRASTQTKTFEVTYQVDQPDNGILLPGMTGNAQISLYDFEDDAFMVPTRVVFGDIYMNPHVWILAPATNTVSAREVSIGRNAGRSIAITGGVTPGEVLASSHVSFLREGEQVELLDDSADPQG